MDTPSPGRAPLLAIDPGREKCGMAVVTWTGEVVVQEIAETDALPLRVAHFVGRYGIDVVVMGDRTGAKETRDALRRAGFGFEIAFVDEDRSSEEGRRRYLQANRGGGWRRFVPIGLLTPDQPYDDFVAAVLAERYLAGQRSTRLRRSTVRPPRALALPEDAPAPAADASETPTPQSALERRRSMSRAARRRAREQWTPPEDTPPTEERQSGEERLADSE